MTLALVLGGGGLVGIAWETGLLAGLRRAGLDLSRSDLIVGTSAGAVVGAQLATGCDLDELYAHQLQSLMLAQGSAAPLPSVDTAAFGRAYREAAPAGMMNQPARARLGELALEAETISEDSHLAAIQALLPVHDWSERRLLITAIDAGDGSFVVWDRDSRVPLPLAVAASCAVPLIFPPMTVQGRPYMDGGLRSAANADLAQGCDGVIILAASARLAGQAAPVEAEASRLRAGGQRVEVVAPDDDSALAFGLNFMDTAHRVPAARAGFAQAESVLAALRATV